MKRIVILLVALMGIVYGQNVDPETFTSITDSATAAGKFVYTNTGGEGKIPVDSIPVWFGLSGGSNWSISGKYEPIVTGLPFRISTFQDLEIINDSINIGGPKVPFAGVYGFHESGLWLQGSGEFTNIGRPGRHAIIGHFSALGVTAVDVSTTDVNIDARNNFSVDSENSNEINAPVNVITNGSSIFRVDDNVNVNTDTVNIDINNAEINVQNNIEVLCDSFEIEVTNYRGLVLKGNAGTGFTMRNEFTGNTSHIQLETNDGLDISSSGELSITPGASEAVSLNGEGGVVLRSWTTAQRPAFPMSGTYGFNSTISKFEGWDGSTWVAFH